MVDANIDMPHQALPGPLIIGGNLIFPHPTAHSGGGTVSGIRLEQAAFHGHDLMTAGAEEANSPIRPHRILAFIPVARRVFSPNYFLHLHTGASQPFQGVLHSLPFCPKLLGIGKMPEITAAALSVIRAVRGGAFRGRLENTDDFSHGGSFHHFGNSDIGALTPDGLGYKDDRAVQPDDPQTLAGIALHAASITGVLL